MLLLYQISFGGKDTALSYAAQYSETAVPGLGKGIVAA
jgi:hypothetical protein